jgi:hypothetical protein
MEREAHFLGLTLAFRRAAGRLSRESGGAGGRPSARGVGLPPWLASADRADLNCPPRLGLPEDVRRVGLRLRRGRSVAALPCRAGLTAVIRERR